MLVCKRLSFINPRVLDSWVDDAAEVVANTSHIEPDGTTDALRFN
jgi:hypothetical protein